MRSFIFLLSQNEDCMSRSLKFKSYTRSLPCGTFLLICPVSKCRQEEVLLASEYEDRQPVECIKTRSLSQTKVHGNPLLFPEESSKYKFIIVVTHLYLRTQFKMPEKEMSLVEVGSKFWLKMGMGLNKQSSTMKTILKNRIIRTIFYVLSVPIGVHIAGM